MPVAAWRPRWVGTLGRRPDFGSGSGKLEIDTEAQSKPLFKVVFLFNNYYSTIKRFISQLQIHCIINYFLSIFNTSYICRKIRCDGKFCKVLGFWVYLNNALDRD
jgi:hypothetical protein